MMGCIVTACALCQWGSLCQCHPPTHPTTHPPYLQAGELQGEVRRLAAARTDALERAEASEAHVMEVLQRQEEAREQAQAERRAFVEQMVGTWGPGSGYGRCLEDAGKMPPSWS